MVTRRGVLGLRLLAAALCATHSFAADPPSKPQRLVSICLQGDQLLLQLVPRERIVAVSQFAADSDLSAHWEQAHGIPVTHGNAEGLVQLKPDLVLISTYTPRIVVTALQQLGVRVLELGIPNDFDELRAQIRLAGQRLGEAARAEEIVHSMDARLSQLHARRPLLAERPSALFYFQDGFVPGAHTFANAILELAGFRNLGSNFGSSVGSSASLEAILMTRPQYLILTRYREAAPTHTQYSASLPIFRKLGDQTKIISVSFRHLASPDPSNLDLVETLQEHLLSK